MLVASGCEPPKDPGQGDERCETTIDTQPPALTNSSTAEFGFSSSRGCRLECRLDDGQFEPCDAEHTLSGLSDGEHTFEVRGGGDPTPATVVWTVDTTKPDTTATCPPALVYTGDVDIAIASSEAESTFSCRLDGEAEAGCTSPFLRSGLSIGSHTFTVVATDRAGNKDDAPATCQFTVDTQGPVVTVTFSPSVGDLVAPSGQASFFAPGNVSYACTVNLGGGAQTQDPCTSPISWSGLAHGAPVSLSVTATDSSSSKKGPVTTRTATVDAQGPIIERTAGPGELACPSSSEATRFAFTAGGDEPSGPSTFTCQLDGLAPVNCTSGADQGVFSWTDLDAGPHQLVIVAHDALGNAGPPDTGDFQVADDPDELPMSAVLSGALDKGGTLVTSGSSTVNLGTPYEIVVTAGETSRPAPSVVCTLDGAEVPCTEVALDSSGIDHVFTFHFEGLLDGNAGGESPHQATLEATHACGSVTEASLTWVVDATPPVVDLVAFDPPYVEAGAQSDAVTGPSNTLSFSIFDDESPGSPEPMPYSVECDLPWEGTRACAMTGGPSLPAVTLFFAESFEDLEGPQVVTITAVDEVGNRSETDIHWCVDATPPDIVFEHTPVVGTCEDVDGMAIGLPSGTVDFSLWDDGGCANAGVAEARCTLFSRSQGGVLSVVAGYDEVDCSDLSFELGVEAGLEPLPDGAYSAVVLVTDAVGLTGERWLTFRVDGTPPEIGFESPSHPSPAQPLANVVAAADVGSFVTPYDPSAQPPAFTCTLNGVSQECNDLTYDVAELEETAAGYGLVVSGTDCVGNTAQASLRFFVDRLPPQLVAAPDCDDGVSCAVDVAQHQASLTLSFADAISNVESVECLLDFDAEGNNPDLPSLFPPVFVSCAQLGFLGLPGQSSASEETPRAPQAVTGTISAAELSPGRHKLWYRATDFWGRTSETQVVELTMDATSQPGVRGHVVAIGHDYVEYEGGAAILLGNAVALAPAMGFERPIRVLTLDLGLVDSEQGPDGPPSDVVTSILDARLDEIGGCGWSCYEPHLFIGDALAPDEGLAARLLGRDVLLIYDQNNPEAVAQVGGKPAWQAALREFLDRGGIVIVLDGVVDRAAPEAVLSQTVTILGGPEQPTLLATAGYQLVAGTVRGECGDSPLMNDVGDGAPLYDTAGAVGLWPDPAAGEVFSARILAPGAPRYTPLVLDRKFPTRTDLGPIRLWAFRDGVQRASGLAAFSLPSGELAAVCPLRPDGYATLELPAGGFVTVAALDKTCGCDDGSGVYYEVGACSECAGVCECSGWRTLETIAGVQPLDELLVGRVLEPVEWLGTVNAGADYVDDAAYYSLSDGCQTVSDLPWPEASLELTTACADWSTGVPSVNLVLAAHGASGQVFAYTVASERQAYWDGAQWLVEAFAWPAWISPARVVDVVYDAPPQHDVQETWVDQAFGGFLYGEGLPIDGQVPFWAGVPDPVISFPAALHVSGRLGTDEVADQRVSYVELTEVAAPPAASGPFALEGDDFPSRFVPVFSGPPERVQLSWTDQATGAPLASADGGFVRLGYDVPGFDCLIADGDVLSVTGGSWLVAFPTGDDSLTLPDLATAPELGCWIPTSQPVDDHVTFLDVSPGVDAADMRSAPFYWLEEAWREAGGLTVGTMVRRSTSVRY